MSDGSRMLRQAFGRFATGVCIAAVPGAAGRPATGITINSFTSVSLSPPLLLWCIDHGSDRYGAFATAEHFSISVLSAGQRALSARLARKGEGALLPDELASGPDPAPQIAGALAVFQCRVTDRHPAGDHDILVGLVTAQAARDGEPLLYFAGQYRALAAAEAV